MKKTVKVAFSLLIALSLAFSAITPAYAADLSQAEIKAVALKQMRLFKGVSVNDFELGRAPTRAEALVLLIRVLGKESEALSGTWSHPFTDVPSWADKYIGYAYQNGLTKGVSATELGSGNANSDMYLTFMLRALGYDDAAGDFAWDEPDTLAASSGILPDGVNTSDFQRSDAVLISWAALEAKLKRGSQTLADKLIEMQALETAEYTYAKLFVEKSGGTSVTSISDLQTACENKDITAIQIASDMELTGDLFIDRESGPSALIYIKEGVTLTVTGELTLVGCYIVNDGTMTVSGIISRGLGGVTNNGAVTVKTGGEFSSGMSDTYNRGTIVIENGGKLPIDRGTQFYNYGTLTNGGDITVDNGGSLFNTFGKIQNEGTINLISYFQGNVTDILGTGTVNDSRQ